MSIESFNMINSLDTGYPLSTDPKSEGDDHIRGIKTTLKNQFPNFSGTAIVPDEATINSLVVSNVTGTTILTGIVNSNGTVNSGSGFSVVRNGQGNYTITFSTNFGVAPTVVVTCNGAPATCFCSIPANYGVVVDTYAIATGTSLDCNFTFTAIGVK